MEKDFAIGLAMGLVGGALIVANSYKARKLVKDGQNQIKNKAASICKQKKSDDYDDLED